MAESAKILNPQKTILIPDILADCPMAHMANIKAIEETRLKYSDVAVVCYINSTAEIKAHSDVCVTSSNAIKIISYIPQKNILFIPDNNLGRYIAKKVPEKNIILNHGFCHVHTEIKKENLLEMMSLHKNAKVLVHPECTIDILDMADYIGSTSGIINYAKQSDTKEFIICTEAGVLCTLRQENPDKVFYTVNKEQTCPDMKLITLEKINNVMKNFKNKIELNKPVSINAKKSLLLMHEIAK